ncbi:MAG: hypothetical protein GWP05_05375 [Anaerolineaceae bacterium]|nr:hypothetical protein [Anaerolineaceae bacterium]
MGSLGLFRTKIGEVARHARVVIKSDRGLEIGTVLCMGNRQMAYEGRPLKRAGTIRRIATHDDLIDEGHLHKSEQKERKFCEQRIKDRGLPMQLVAVEHLFGGDRIIFFFLAEGRVDFRDLVKDLAEEYQTRIEMRQIGVRDEARLLADYERCGQFICCRAFIKEFQPISMKMAKTQKATLDPSKISGRCGRLMCCLRFENETYEELKKTLPRKNSYVQTEMGPGKVIGGSVLTQLVRVSIAGKVQIVPAESITDRDLTPQQVEEALAAGRQIGRPSNGGRRSRRKPEGDKPRGGRSKKAKDGKETASGDRTRKPSGEGAAKAAEPKTGEAGEARPKRKRRSRRRGRKPQSEQPAAGGGQPAASTAGIGGREVSGKKSKGLGVPKAVLEHLGVISDDQGSPPPKTEAAAEVPQSEQPRKKRRRGRRSRRRSSGKPSDGGSPESSSSQQK